MEVKITTKKLADLMVANRKDGDPLMLTSSVEVMMRKTLGDDFVNEAWTMAKNTLMEDYAKEGICKRCDHCHRVKMPCSSFISDVHGYCDLLGQQVRMRGLCRDTKKEGGAE